jgi:hypothetical protein
MKSFFFALFGVLLGSLARGGLGGGGGLGVLLGLHFLLVSFLGSLDDGGVY